MKIFHHRYNIVNYIILFLAVAASVFYFASELYLQREAIFDDAFITYRYARNLAEGYGITWNRLEPPTEGYTSFMHVVILAPFLKMGFDPLKTTRMLGILALAGTALLLGLHARKYYHASTLTALLVAVLYLPAANSGFVIGLGLETVIYAFLLYLAFHIYTLYLECGSMKIFAALCAALFVAFLTRPDAAIMSCVVIAASLFNFRSRKKQAASILVCLLLFLAMPTALYFLWKKIHFGYLLPNPFYLKVGAGGLISDLGIESVKRYASLAKKLLVLALLAILIFRRGIPQRHRLLCLLFIGSYATFYLHVNTFMDLGVRFLYPVTPFLYYLTLPLTVWIIERLLSSGWRWTVRIPAASAVLLLLFFYPSPWRIASTVKNAAEGKNFYTSFMLMQKEHELARVLATYPDIKNISIACGDAGVIPYYTRSEHLDVYGLNDAFIARERNMEKLVDYFFSKKPTLVIHPSSSPSLNTWITSAHGPLGNFMLWAGDHRWDEYLYAGTVPTSNYDLNFLVRKDYPLQRELFAFIRNYVADKSINKMPLPLGTRKYLAIEPK